METINLGSMTQEQKQHLWNQMQAELRAAEIKKQEDKKSYEQLKDELVRDTFDRLSGVASGLSSVKCQTFDNFQILMDMKQALYEISDEQMERQGSHSFTSTDGSNTIMLGQNVVDGWDEDLAGAGVARVNDWLTSKLTNDNRVLVDMVRDLLRPSKEGTLKASRVLELSKRAQEMGDAQLTEAVAMLQEAYRPQKTSTYIKAKFRNNNGQDEWLNLSLSSAK